MVEKTRVINLVVCAVFGLLGGIVSHLILTTRTASAQQTSSVVRAERFELIDEKGNVRALLRRNPDFLESAELVIRGGRREATLDSQAVVFSENSRDRVALGWHPAFVDGGPALDPAEYQLLIYDKNGKTKHRLR